MALLLNADTGAIVATRVDRAKTFLDRFIGLLTRSAVRHDEGIWIEPCSAIHTIGMRATIDVIFVDGERRVVGIVPYVPAQRLSVSNARARAVIELGAGALRHTDVLIGDRLELV